MEPTKSTKQESPSNSKQEDLKRKYDIDPLSDDDEDKPSYG